MINQRTATKAAIKRASASARVRMNRLDKEYLGELEQVYRRARTSIEDAIESYGDSSGSLRLSTLQDLLGQVNTRLGELSKSRNSLLDKGLGEAGKLGADPFVQAGLHTSMTKIADEALRFAHSFVAADGLQLSDRLWRLDRGAREAVGAAVEQAVIQGHSASQAAQDFIARGQSVPPEIAAKAGAASAASVATAAGVALMQSDNNAYENARRVFRTELNRAHGEAYMRAGEDHPDFGGWKFLLSPAHPRPDQCDMHASANLYGRGPGVYPDRSSCPWPAHPNTISYTEIVFKDEIGPSDKAGKLSRLAWLKIQPASMQTAVLNSRMKQVALQKGILRENEIRTPWNVLKEKYQRRGVDLSSFTAERTPRPKPERIKGTLIIGMDPKAFSDYADAAMADAPKAARAAMDRVIKPSSIHVIPTGGSYFQHDSITLAKTSMVKRSGFHSAHDVYRHEYGHYIDFWATSDGKRVKAVLSSTPDAAGGLADTLNAARKSLEARSQAGKDRRARMMNDLLQRQDTNLADLFGALTLNKIGWGHSVKYLQQHGFWQTEVFANLFDIYSRGDRSAWKYLSAELPDLSGRFVTVLEGIK